MIEKLENPTATIPINETNETNATTNVSESAPAPAFEAVFTIVGLLTVIYLMRRRN